MYFESYYVVFMPACSGALKLGYCGGWVTVRCFVTVIFSKVLFIYDFRTIFVAAVTHFKTGFEILNFYVVFGDRGVTDRLHHCYYSAMSSSLPSS